MSPSPRRRPDPMVRYYLATPTACATISFVERGECRLPGPVGAPSSNRAASRALRRRCSPLPQRSASPSRRGDFDRRRRIQCRAIVPVTAVGEGPREGPHRKPQAATRCEERRARAGETLERRRASPFALGSPVEDGKAACRARVAARWPLPKRGPGGEIESGRARSPWPCAASAVAVMRGAIVSGCGTRSPRTPRQTARRRRHRT